MQGQRRTDWANQTGAPTHCQWGNGRTGGSRLGRGHIHHVLTNPIYAGRIRHKTEFFPGQHVAIIDPERWDRVQQMLQAQAAKPRATQTGQSLAPLAGKIFDETGDRLTPTHTKTFAEIAKQAGVNTSRIRQMIDLAFLAPDLVRDILNGDQPIGLTSDWVRTNALPIDWQAQRDTIAKL